jgi:hypothetical protein
MELDLSSIDEIYDKLEDEEDMGIVSLMLKLPNLCMVAVITMSVYVAW